MTLTRQQEQFTAAIKEHKALIHKVARSYSQDEDDLQDLVQDIIIRLWYAFSRYDAQYKLSTWMYRIALNVSITHSKKEYKRVKLAAPLTESILHLNTAPAPEEESEDLQRLQRYIKELRELDRALILLHLEGHDQQEIAGIMGISLTNVSTRLSRVKDRLRQKFNR